MGTICMRLDRLIYNHTYLLSLYEKQLETTAIK